MNFLAHLFLSGQPGEQMVGNFIADSVKGSELSKFSPGIQEGIRLHRAIDSFTDSHPQTLKSKERLRKQYGKYASVIVDIFYDHFLAIHWNDHSSVDLRSYTKEVYDFLGTYYPIFPVRSQSFYTYMTKYDILFAYRKIEGIEQVMKGMSRRAKFESGMETAAEALEADHDKYEKEFQAFFPELRAHVSKQAIK